MTDVISCDPVAPTVDGAEEIYLGRQSILDRKFELHAFELLLRMRPYGAANVLDDTVATATVIVRTFNELGIDSVLGKYMGFINVDRNLLMSDEIELLPAHKIGLEILESVRVDAELVAEKVSTEEEARRCMDLGFELFQGYFFAKPKILSGKRLSHSEVTLLKLLSLVVSDADIQDIVTLLKQDPALVTALLRMANSASAALPRRLTSLSQIVIMMGRRQLQRWLQLLIFAHNAGSAAFPSPLLQLAATRGKLMELLSISLAPSNKSFVDKAFMAGIMSLLDALLGKPLAELIAPLNLPPDVNEALLARSGKLCDMLILVEALETSASVTAAMSRIGGLSAGTVTTAHAEALRWANTLGS